MFKHTLFSKRYILTALLFWVVNFTYAATDGCYVAGSGAMYYQTPTPGDPTTFFEGAAFYTDFSQCSNGGQYFTLVTTSGVSCWASYKGSGSKTNSSRYNVSGTKATFDLYLCPLDTYTILLLSSIAGLGFFVLRRTHFTTTVS